MLTSVRASWHKATRFVWRWRRGKREGGGRKNEGGGRVRGGRMREVGGGRMREVGG